jgi:ribosome-associated toxin RatA of RatAB toxin-antitoxin module
MAGLNLRSSKLTQVFKCTLLTLATVIFCGTLLDPATAKGELENLTSATVIHEETINGKSFQVSHGLIKAKPEAVWHILTNYEQAPRFFSMLLKCKVLEEKGNVKVVDYTVRPSGPVGSYQYVLELKEQPMHQITWHRVSGSFKDIDGFWKLESVDGGKATMVTYGSSINGGFFFPQALIKRQIRIDIPTVMASLKTGAEQLQIAKRPEQNSKSTTVH